MLKHRKKLIVGLCVCLFATLLLLVPIIYLQLGSIAFDLLFKVDAQHTNCKFETPANFSTHTKCIHFKNITLHDYFTEQYATIQFPARDATWHGNLSAYLLLNNSNAPYLIGMNGFRSCKHNYVELVSARMLQRNGFNVVMMDLRNHGLSQVDTQYPYATFGQQEHKDVLGALDYITNTLQYTGNVGLFGCSMGGAVTLVSLPMSARFIGAFVDSPACLVRYSVESFMAQVTGAALSPAIFNAACAINKTPFGCPPFAIDPYDAAARLGPFKSIYFFHAQNDLLVPLRNSHVCSKLAQESKATVYTYWNITSSPPPHEKFACDGHCQGMLHNLTQYEQRMVNYFKSLKY